MTKFLVRELLEDLQDIKNQTDISDQEYYDLLIMAYKFRLKLKPDLPNEELAEIIKTALEFYQNPTDEISNKMSNLANNLENVTDNDYEAEVLKIMEEYQQMEKDAKKAVPACFYRALVALGYVKEKHVEPLTEGLSEEEFDQLMEQKFKSDVERQLQSVNLIRPRDIFIRASKETFNNISTIVLNFYWYETFLGNIKVSENNEVQWLINQGNYRQYSKYLNGILKYINFGPKHECWKRINYFINSSGIIVNNEVQSGRSSKESIVVDDDGYVVSPKKQVF